MQILVSALNSIKDAQMHRLVRPAFLEQKVISNLWLYSHEQSKQLTYRGKTEEKFEKVKLFVALQSEF